LEFGMDGNMVKKIEPDGNYTIHIAGWMMHRKSPTPITGGETPIAGGETPALPIFYKNGEGERGGGGEEI
jgi:hypothetical protein